MEITEVRVKLVNVKNDKLRAFCSITVDNDFVIRDLKVIEGAKGAFVAMPSRKLTERCSRCGGKNHYRARFCNDCGARLGGDRGSRFESTSQKMHTDIAHPINSRCREVIQKRVLEVYLQEVQKSSEPDYRPMEFEVFDEESLADESAEVGGVVSDGAGVLPPHSPRGDGSVLPPHSPRGDGGVLPSHSPRGDGGVFSRGDGAAFTSPPQGDADGGNGGQGDGHPHQAAPSEGEPAPDLSPSRTPEGHREGGRRFDSPHRDGGEDRGRRNRRGFRGRVEGGRAGGEGARVGGDAGRDRSEPRRGSWGGHGGGRGGEGHREPERHRPEGERAGLERGRAQESGVPLHEEERVETISDREVLSDLSSRAALPRPRNESPATEPDPEPEDNFGAGLFN